MDRAEQIIQLSTHMHASVYRLLVLIRTFDQEEEWKPFSSCAEWLATHCGLTLNPARERVRVAHALASLPLISAAFEKGSLSWSHVRALTRGATPENEEKLLERLEGATVAQTERIIRELGDARGSFAPRGSLAVTVDDQGHYRVSGRLSPELGVRLMRALEKHQDRLFREREQEQRPGWATAGELRHDALEALLDERTTTAVEVVVHALAGTNLMVTEDGVRVSAETSEEISSDASTVLVERDRNGTILNLGKRRRSPNQALLRALKIRDGGCRFPGCEGKFTQAHHAKPWSEGGTTSLDNLILLCRRHHRAMHRDGWSVELLGASGEAVFRTARGREVPAGAPVREVEIPNTPDAGLFKWHRQARVEPLRVNKEFNRALFGLWLRRQE